MSIVTKDGMVYSIAGRQLPKQCNDSYKTPQIFCNDKIAKNDNTLQPVVVCLVTWPFSRVRSG